MASTMPKWMREDEQARQALADEIAINEQSKILPIGGRDAKALLTLFMDKMRNLTEEELNEARRWKEDGIGD